MAYNHREDDEFYLGPTTEAEHLAAEMARGGCLPSPRSWPKPQWGVMLKIEQDMRAAYVLLCGNRRERRGQAIQDLTP